LFKSDAGTTRESELMVLYGYDDANPSNWIGIVSDGTNYIVQLSDGRVLRRKSTRRHCRRYIRLSE
jgi:hypothetical protein